ncbi:MAG TPA: DUF885 domain-containing protein [Candidatus Limnocylindrales bacterium]|nr:DUF885 domain-containing protein [Candidatus Limnocylindrales bacterium]
MTESTTPSSTSPVDDLADRFWEDILELNPTTATVYGDERYNDRLEDPSAAGRARVRRLMEKTKAAAEAISPDGLPVEDRITRDMLIVIADQGIEEDDQGIHRLRVVDQINGPQQLLPQIATFQPADTPERLETLLTRLHAYRDFMAANTDILREGLETGLTAPRIVAERTVAQLERLIAIPIDEAVIPSLAQVASDVDRERVREVVRDIVYPADAAFLRVLRDDYLAETRDDPGLWSAPRGDALYRTQIRSWTTLDLDPRDVHQIGMEELRAVDARRREIATAAGAADPNAYRARLDADPANTPSTKEELLERAREDIDRAMAIAPRFFGVLPKAGIEVKAVEEFKEKDAPFAYYFPPATDGSRGGTYYANGYDLHNRKYTKLATTTYHEAVPGHHFQIALEQENPNLSTFRRLGARIVGSAYVEGWGLYSEKLADEMGLFRDDSERFGMLDAIAWRAARLVVDTGLHALRWTRRQSIDFLLQTGLSDTDATIETDRYIAWPGQALTYMIGCREIEKLRRELTARDGSRFDLRAFHDAVLGHGSLPLATLSRELPNWVATPA